jgi:hypothetical protein
MAYCAAKTGGSSYEEIALATHGPGFQKFTSICMIPTNMGFVVSYVVLVSDQVKLSIMTPLFYLVQIVCSLFFWTCWHHVADLV